MADNCAINSSCCVYVLSFYKGLCAVSVTVSLLYTFRIAQDS